jgi:hypothetical protein
MIHLKREIKVMGTGFYVKKVLKEDIHDEN